VGLILRHSEPYCGLCDAMLTRSKTLAPEDAIELLQASTAGHRAYALLSANEYRNVLNQTHEPKRKLGFQMEKP
jgi:hypothetical protein